MLRVIYLNGPINCGKDTIGELLHKELESRGIKVMTTMFKKQLYKVAALVADMDLDQFIKLASDRSTKEEPLYLLPRNQDTGTYFTPREWLIHISELVVKPLAGKDYFGKQAGAEILDWYRPLYKESQKADGMWPLDSWGSKPQFVTAAIITDSGFAEEREATRKVIGDGRLTIDGGIHTLVRISRPGTSFAGDSRSYLPNPDVELENSGSLEDLQAKVIRLAAYLFPPSKF